MREYRMRQADATGFWNAQLERESSIEGRKAKQVFKHQIAVMTANVIMDEIGLEWVGSPQLKPWESERYVRRQDRITRPVEVGSLSDDLYTLPAGEVRFEQTRYWDRKPPTLGRLGLGKTVEPISEAIAIIHSEWDENPEEGDARNPVLNVERPFDHNFDVDRFCVWLEQIAQEHDYPLPYFGNIALLR